MTRTTPTLPATDDDGTSLWRPFLAALPLTGASISVMGGGVVSTVSTSDPLAAQLDALQLQLGEGPHWNAFRSGAPVLVPDVRGTSAQATWPLFGNAVLQTAARGVWAFPLMLGALIVGVADLYSDSVGTDWSDRLIADATGIAATTAGIAVELATRSAGAEQQTADASAVELRREVHQATGMVIVQLGVSPEVALARLQAHAFTTARPVLEVAQDVVQRRLDFGIDAE